MPVSASQPTFIISKYGTQQLCYERHIFNRHVCRQNIIYWRCTQFAVLRCRARIKTHQDQMTLLNIEHNHPIITEGRKYGELKEFKRRQQLQTGTAGKRAKVEPSFEDVGRTVTVITPLPPKNVVEVVPEVVEDDDDVEVIEEVYHIM